MDNHQPEPQKPRRCRRSSAVLIESAINGINILRRSLQDEIEEPTEEEECDWTISSPITPSPSPGPAECSLLALKDIEADREFTEGMSKYFDGNDSGATIHFSRTVEMRQAIQEDVTACALFEDEAIRQRHERQLRHAKLCLDDMAGKPAEVASVKKNTVNGDLLVDFISPSTRRMKMEKSCDQSSCEADSGYSLPKGYELEDESSSSGDSFLLDAQANRRLSCAMNLPPAMLKGESDAKCWQHPVKQMEMGKPPLADNGKLPDEIELFIAKANSSAAAFHNSCVSDLCWDSAASLNLGGEDLKDLCWAASKQTAMTKGIERPMFPPMKRLSAVKRTSTFSRAA